MSKRPDNINFDHFKSQFEEQSSQNLGWNDPPDFVFDEAIAVVNGQKNLDNKKNLFLLLALLGIGLLIGVLLYSHKKVTTLEHKVDLLSVGSLDSDISSHNGDGTLDKGQALDAAVSSDDSKVVDRKEEIVVAEYSTSNLVNNTFANKPAITSEISEEPKVINASNAFDQNSATIIRDIQVNETAVSEYSRLSNPTKDNKVNPAPIGGSDILYNLKMLDYKIYPLETESRPIELYNDISWAEKAAKNDFTISFAAIRNFTTLSMSEYSGPQVLTAYDDYYSGVGYQVGLSLPVSPKLNWVNAVAYNRFNNESFNTSSNSYNKINEFSINPGSTMYLMDMDIESPVGVLNETMAFEVDPLLTNEGDVIEDKVTIGQYLNVFSLSTGLEYALVQTKNINWYARTSIGAAYISKLATRMDSEIIMNDKTMDTFSTSFEKVKNLNSLYSFLEVSSGVDYKLSQKYSLTFGVGYSKSINSLRSGATGEPKTHLHNWSTTLGVSRSF